MLKSCKVNNHGKGKLEVTFFREYQRAVRLQIIVSARIVSNFILTLCRCQVSTLSAFKMSEKMSEADAIMCACAQLMNATSSETTVCGTVASII